MFTEIQCVYSKFSAPFCRDHKVHGRSNIAAHQQQKARLTSTALSKAAGNNSQCTFSHALVSRKMGIFFELRGLSRASAPTCSRNWLPALSGSMSCRHSSAGTVDFLLNCFDACIYTQLLVNKQARGRPWSNRGLTTVAGHRLRQSLH